MKIKKIKLCCGTTECNYNSKSHSAHCNFKHKSNPNLCDSFAPQMDKKNVFLFSASLHVCLKRTHAAVKTRSSCGCITGAVAASKQAADKKKKHTKKKRSNFGEHCYSSLLSAVFSPALAALLSTSKMASGLLSTAGLIPLCRQIISAAQNDTARRCEARPGRD